MTLPGRFESLNLSFTSRSVNFKGDLDFYSLENRMLHDPDPGTSFSVEAMYSLSILLLLWSTRHLLPAYSVTAASTPTFNATISISLPNSSPILPAPPGPPQRDIGCVDRRFAPWALPVNLRICSNTLRQITQDPKYREVQTYGPNFGIHIWGYPQENCRIFFKSLRPRAIEHLSFANVLRAAADIFGDCNAQGYGGVKIIGQSRGFYTGVYATRRRGDDEAVEGTLENTTTSAFFMEYLFKDDKGGITN